MASVLSSFFARDPKSQFAYDIPASSEFIHNGIHLASSFKKAEPTELATIFWATGADAAVLKTQAQKLKTMRHPNILTYLDSIEIENVFYLVSEKCRPLRNYLETINLLDQKKEFVVSWGLFQVMSGLRFLHEAKLTHQKVRDAVFVTAGGDWKLSSLQNVCAITNPLEDSNQLAVLIWEIFNGFSDRMISKPPPPGKISSRLLELYKKLASPSAAKLTFSELIRDCRSTGGFFKNKFVDTLLFLEEFQLKESNEKQSFFVHLRENLDIFPDDIAKFKILPRLIMTYEYGDAGPNILIPLFKLGRLLEEDEYQRKIVPCLVKLFGSTDRMTRVKLLDKIEEFGPHLTSQLVNDKIFGNIVVGFVDTSPVVRESTVKAMVTLAEKLNFNNLNVELMKHFARLQGGDEHGGIRTNTTICLGKIASLLDPSKRQNILISAFTRGMRDPFPPARHAAVLAVAATQQFYSLMDVANKVLPAISPLTCDPEKDVREQAFKAMHGFLEKLEKASQNPEIIPELEAQVKAGGRSLLSSDKVPQWASWALKSLSGKIYKIENKPPTDNKPSGEKPVPSTNIEKQVSSTTNVAQISPKSVSDGWGDLDDDDDFRSDEWADAPEPADHVDDEDDWSSGWETAAPVKVDAPPAKPVENKINKSIGVNKVERKPVQGITTVKETSGWDDFGNSEPASESGSGWDDSAWGDECLPATEKPVAPPAISSLNKDREARKAEALARQEARKKELAEKRAAKGAMKLTAKKVETKMDDFADW